MRATMSFDIEVDQVESTMRLLIAQEADTLRAAADMIDVQSGPHNMVLEEVTESLRLLQESSAQLEQYRGMLVSFERARFETMLPQEVAESPPPADIAGPKQFKDFLGRIGEDISDENAEEG